MGKALYLLLLATCANCYYVEESPTSAPKERIVGGNEVKIEDVPYIAQVLLHDRISCGASIISEYWLLTAGHCVEVTTGISVMTGTTLREIGGVVHEINETVTHKNYDTFTLDNDIALIKLKNPIVFNNTQQAISISTTEPKVGDKLKISGYGRIQENYPHSRVLKSTVVPVIDFGVCRQQYFKDVMTDNMFCAGVGGTDSCQGDSGGPAVVDGKIAGVISNGEGCASLKYAGVYTKVYNYLSWISEKTGLKL